MRQSQVKARVLQLTYTCTCSFLQPRNVSQAFLVRPNRSAILPDYDPSTRLHPTKSRHPTVKSPANLRIAPEPHKNSTPQSSRNRRVRKKLVQWDQLHSRHVITSGKFHDAVTDAVAGIPSRHNVRLIAETAVNVAGDGSFRVLPITFENSSE